MDNCVSAAANTVRAINATPLRVIDISGLALKSQVVNLGNYFVLVLAILKISKLTALLIDKPILGNFLLVPTGIVLYAFCGWAVWHATNSFDAIASRYIIPAFIVILALTVISLPVFLAFTPLDIFCLPFVIAGLVMVIVLRRTRPPEWNQRLDDILRHGFVRTPSPGLRPAKAKRWLAYVCLTLAFLWFICMGLIPFDYANDGKNLRAYNLMYGFGFLLLIYARMCWRPNYQAVMDNDPRKPFLFLRAFEDDRKATRWISSLGPTMYGFFGYSLLDYSLESKLAAHFSQFGPFVAFAAPRNNPALGAIRIRLLDEEWQNAVTALMDKARLNIVFVGIGKGISWELKKIISSGQAGKTILLFPWMPHRFFRKPVNPAERLQSVVPYFQGTIWSSPASQLEQSCMQARILPSMRWPLKPEMIRAIVCTSGSLVAITSILPSRESHYVAAVLAHYMMQGEREEESADDAEPSSLADAAVGQPASISARVLATMIDATLLFTFWATVEYTSALGGVADPLGFLGLVFGYYFVLEGWLGATIGKMIVNAAVVSTRGQPCSFRGAAVRNLLRFVDISPLYGIWVAIAKSSVFTQRMGDRFAGTLVVRKRRRGVLRILLAVACAIPLGVAIDFAAKLGSVYVNPHVTIGARDEVYFSGSINRETAMALGESLKSTGFFTDKGVTVFVTKDAGAPVISFVVEEGSWDQEGTILGFELAGVQIASSVGGLPIKIRLTDDAFNSKKELSIGRVTVGTHDRIYYLGFANEGEAKTLGATFRRIQFFRDRGATVLLSKGVRTIVSFVVEEGAWDKPKRIRSFEEVVRQAAPSIGGFPITVHLCGSGFDTKKEFTVQ